MKRRTFLAGMPALAAGLALGNKLVQAGPIRIDSPFHGAVLHERLKEPVLGRVVDSLKIRVTGAAPENVAVAVNGIPARRNGKRFEADIELKDRETEIVASAGADRASIKVVWLKNSFPRWRFTVDDTIYCLREIHRKNPKSLFDDYFLGNLRKLHEKYGMKVGLNLFYESEDGFNLSQFSDKYKSEFRDNADWLRLLFHAKSEFPNRPYADATPEKLTEDFRQIEREIKRFAGDESYLPVTVVHWGDVPQRSWKTLAGLGVTVLSGYFVEQNGQYPVSYQMDAARCRYLEKHDFLVDFDSGITFSRMDMIINTVPLERVLPQLEAAVADPNTAEFVDLMTHEQYFWPFYKNYMPDHWDRLETAFRFVTERGYKPVFLNDPPLGAG